MRRERFRIAIKTPTFVAIFAILALICMTGVGSAVVYHGNEVISTDTTWAAEVHVINASSTVQVSDGVTLTISPGAVVKFESASAMMSVLGTLNVSGTPTNNVVFTSLKDDSYGGDTNNDGDATSPAAGDWKSIALYGSSTNDGIGIFDHCILRYGGSKPSCPANVYSLQSDLFTFKNSVSEHSLKNGIYCDRSSPVITSSTFHNNSIHGFNSTDGSPTVTSSTFSHNGNHGISCTGGSPTVTNNTFTNNTLYATYLSSVTIMSFRDNTGSGNGKNGCGISGTVSTNQIWNTSFPYIILNAGVTVSDGRTLTFDPGVVVKFESASAMMSVLGTLNVSGTPTNNVVFTSIKDDSYGGDTNNDGDATSPAAGDWKSIALYGSSTNDGIGIFDHCILRYGGSKPSCPANVYSLQSDLFTFKNSVSDYSLRNGIYLSNTENSVITKNTVKNSNGCGIYVSSSTNNEIYLNNFTGNSNNVCSYSSTNFWNSTVPMTYTYNDQTRTNYLGNYWDDYTDIDANNDGIWDNPRPIDSDKDYHPLVEPYYAHPPEYSVGQGAPTEAIKNHFIAAYNRNGGITVLGNPATAVHRAWGYLVQDFPGASDYAGGIIMYNPYNDYAYYIHGAIWDRYYSLGGPRAKTDIEFELGPPISDIEPYVHTLQPEVSSHGTQFRYQNFEGGALDLSVDTGAVFEVHGAIFAKWKALGYAAGDLGLVTSDEREAAISAIGTEGRVSDFEGGHIHWHRNGALANTAFETHGVIDVVYCSEGGSGGWLGFPVSDEYVNPSGYAQSDFEDGYITTTDGVIYEAYGKEDTTPPTLTIVHPIYLHDNMIDLTGTAYDVSGILNNEVLIKIDSDEFDGCRYFFAPYNSITGWWRLTDIPIGYGNTVITVYAQDTNHNVAEETTSVYLAHPDFSFVHITDAHIDDDCKTKWNWNKMKKETYCESQEKFSSTLWEVNNKKPAFILDTGDCVEYDNRSLFIRYMELLDRYIDEDIGIYHTSGNHDRRTGSFPYPATNLINYTEIVKHRESAGSPVTALEDGYDDYYFESGGYLFIGIESGEDYSVVDFLTPEGSGLEDDQYNCLLESDIKNHPKKIIFMHHPVINEGDDGGFNAVLNRCPEKGGNDMCIKTYRCHLIHYCNNHGVQLVLTGHTHKSYDGKVSNTHFIQTPSATKPGGRWPFQVKPGYRIIDIKNGKAYPQRYTQTGAHSNVKGSLKCPAHLHAYDSQGRHTGLNASGGVEHNIPDSFYIGRYNNSDPNETETILLYNTTEDYRFEIVANLTEEETESFNFTVEQQTDDTRTTIDHLNVPLSENTTATLPINLTTTAYTMEIDYNGDGTTDETKDPDFIETNYAPTAAIIAPETGSIYNASESVMFNGTGRDPEDGILTNFSLVWYSDINGVIGDGERFSTANLSAGAHTITLMVNDSVDLRDTDSVMITVVDRTPTANFTYTPGNPIVNQTITFNASGSYDPDGNITDYEWNFGDGNITNTTEEIILHSYALAGNYNVSLTVTDNDGATNTRVLGIAVSSMPDLVVTENWVCWPDNCTICYNVTNIGNEIAPDGHNTTLFVDSIEAAYDHVAVALVPNESYTGCFDDYNWTYTPPDDNITVCADSNNTVAESNETNNCMFNTWRCGDVDGNGIVNVMDVRLLMMHVADPTGYPVKSWACDVDGAGDIDGDDVQLLLGHVFDPEAHPLNCNGD